MAYQMKESLESRTVTSDKNGPVATRTFIVYSDDSEDEGLMFDPEAFYSSSGDIPDLGSPHPTLTGLFVKSREVKMNSETLNRGFLVLTYGRRELSSGGNGAGGGTSTPNENNEIWTWNMISQSTHINAVTSINGVPQQVTFDEENKRGANILTAIGATEDEVLGADIYRPAGTLNVSRTYGTIAEVNQTYRIQLRQLGNTINDARWPEGTNSEFGPGELLFLGADISYNILENTATVNYSFQFGSVVENEEILVWKKDKTGTVAIKIPKRYPFQVASIPMHIERTGEKPNQKFAVNPLSVSLADVYKWADFSVFKLIGA